MAVFFYTECDVDICLGTDCVQLLFMFLPFGVAGGFWGPGRTARRAGARNGAFTARPGGQAWQSLRSLFGTRPAWQLAQGAVPP